MRAVACSSSGGRAVMPYVLLLLVPSQEIAFATFRVNRGYHLKDDYLPNWGMFNMSRSDIVVINIGLW